MQHACFCEFSTVLSELRQMLAAEHAEVLDLPPPLPLSRRGYWPPTSDFGKETGSIAQGLTPFVF